MCIDKIFKMQNNYNHWGHPLWTSIHTLAANYNETPQAADAFVKFMFSLVQLMPCKQCRIHLYNHLTKDLPITSSVLSSRDNLFLWTYKLHDLVNQQLGKFSPPYNVVYSYYVRPNTNRCPQCNMTRH